MRVDGKDVDDKGIRINITFPKGQPGLVEHLEELPKEYRSARMKFYAELGYMDYSTGARSKMIVPRLVKAGVIEDIKQHIYKEMGVDPTGDKGKVVSLVVDKVAGEKDLPEEDGFTMDTDDLIVGTSG